MNLEEIQNQAFGFFEKSRYTECLGVIRSLPPGKRDVPIRILEAVCLIETGNQEDAEVCLRDLRITVPNSAEVCIYLGRILLERGDDEARAAFSEAVRLDPDNKDGLLWYADFLMSQDDYSASIPVLTRLYTLSEDPRVLCRLMQSYVKFGRPEEAIQSFVSNGSPACCRIEYFHALSDAGRDEELIFKIDPDNNTPDEEFVILVRSLGKVSLQKVDSIILPRIASAGSIPVITEYIRLLGNQKRYKEAIGVWSTYLSNESDPYFRILICPALCNLGELSHAEEIYQSVLFPDPPFASITDILNWLKEYYELIRLKQCSVYGLMEEAGQVLHPSYVAFAGFCAEEDGQHDLAHVYYQKAFRSDIVHGGLYYAAYLERIGNLHEWEKIITYILKNTGKVRDLEYVAISNYQKITGNISLLRFLHAKFQRLLPLLSSKGKSIYCQTACLLAGEELKNGRYGEGMTFCLDALAEVPPNDQRMAEHLFSVLMACKTPGLPVRYTIRGIDTEKNATNRDLVIPGLTPEEDAVLQYIRRHRVCSELELRPVCGTRRIAGLMNRLIRKTSAGGWQILIKEGISESGEVYRYAGP